MAKKRHDHPDLIEDFESAAEKLAHWIGENRLLVGSILVVVLGTAAAIGGYRTWDAAREEKASAALDRIRSAYLAALGASPGSLVEPELANPAAAASIREEYLPKFQAVSDQNSGAVAGTLALFEMATLLDALDRQQETEAIWARALEQAAGNPGLEGLLHQRVGEAHERKGDWAEAAESHQRAGHLQAYPLRYWALVDAARCFAAAGEPARALELYEKVTAEAPDLALPPHIRAQLRELRAVAFAS